MADLFFIIAPAIAFFFLVILIILFARYKVCGPSEYAVFTGLFINDMKICKSGILYPFQEVLFVDMTPTNYRFELKNMSKEIVEFFLPVSFTIGPVSPEKDLEAFKNFALKMTSIDEDEKKDTILGVVQGEMRVHCASLTIEEMFSDKESFRTNVWGNVEEELAQFGLTIYNANIEDMQDVEGSRYFKFRRMKALEGAVNESRVEVAEARQKGDIGEKEKRAQARQEIAHIEANAVAAENLANQTVSESEMNVNITNSNCERHMNVANSEASTALGIRQAELDFTLQVKEQSAREERQRANDVSGAKVSAEARICLAEARQQAGMRKAEGTAEATKIKADADFHYRKCVAEGGKIQMDSNADGINLILDASKGDAEMARYTMALETNLYPKLAEASAAAIQNLKPDMSIFETDFDVNKGGSSQDFFTNLAQAIPALSEALQKGAKPTTTSS
eukprot:TRINITY_DN44617_c0_g1_i1.p1 TRINITY_DN44617_c0_g1~~TRINITY_DN44617_c0_g1_i1.p1  ORF type:complete len:465 (+),score=98.89 TRINITY_DN44617_c0_g1_i1:45-1397(+)